MTEKLYYKDAYIKSFSAIVTSAVERDGHFVIELDKTAFFPEEGGQSSDKGRIGEARVLAVEEKDGRIFHTVDMPFSVNESVRCEIDFEDRFDKMQCHTAEHIVSGLIHRLYGFDNVGFHLGNDEITLDINGILNGEMIDKVELLANEAVYKNVPISVFYPSEEVAKGMDYRSKLDITENLRIVEISGYDICACCAPHVNSTGQIGIIKLIDYMKHRGGTRIKMLAGKRAYLDYQEKSKSTLEISAMLAVPRSKIASGVKNYIAASESCEFKLKGAYQRIAALEAELVAPTDKNAVVIVSEIGMQDAREIVNRLMKKVKGVSVVIFGMEGAYSYVMGSENKDMISVCKAANAALSGKGGGRPPMMQGSFVAPADQIKKYFEV